jgi:O-antigen/teichoic acid export membrane protein
VVFNLCGRLSLLSDNILVAFMMNPAAVVPFYLTQRLASMAQREMQGIGNASWAGMGEIFAQHETQLFRNRLIELTRLVAIVGVAALVPISIYNRYFITLWVGADHYGGYLLTTIASINAFLLAVFSLWMWCVTSTGSIARLFVPYAVQTAINFVLSVIFTAEFGLIGPVLGTLVGLIAVSAWFLPRLLSDLFGIRPGLLLKAVGAPLLLGLPYLIGAAWMASSYGRSTWLAMALQMSLCALMYLAAAWLVLLDGSERSIWLGRLRVLFVHRATQPVAQ